MVLLVALLACRPPEAPDAFEDMMTWGFRNFQEPDDTLLALAAKLFPWSEANEEALAGDGYEVSSLTAEDLEAAGVSGGSVTSVIGAAVAHHYVADVDRLADGMTWPDPAEIFSAYEVAVVGPADDRACFLTGRCPTHSSLTSIDGRVAGLGLHYDVQQDLRWVHAEDGATHLFTRTLSPAGVAFEVDWIEVTQQYSFSAVSSRDGRAWRVTAVWVEATLLDDAMPEGAALLLGVSGLQTAARDLDAWMEATAP